MKDSFASVGELLRDEFLAGRQVIASDFARDHDVTRAAVSAAMKQFGAIVTSSPHPNVPSALIWECIDVEAMRCFSPAPRNGAGRPRKKSEDTPIGRLCAAWGIAFIDIALPYTRHRMSVLEDELESI